MCSLHFSVHGAQSRKVPANRYHWSSSQALELMLKPYRVRALMVLTSTAARINQAAPLPILVLIASMRREKDRSACKLESLSFFDLAVTNELV